MGEGRGKEEGTVFLKVFENYGQVCVDIVNEKGEWEWNLAMFNSNGTIHLHEFIPNDDEHAEGIQLDEHGAIVVAK